eukprot:GHVO01066564.1.p1 GENE.GHVO01066564.1~~GHVO01066564.1.p1  ORF type:complete len:420 (-),score=71.34 GHVO01066564.1:51-1310(-)
MSGARRLNRNIPHPGQVRERSFIVHSMVGPAGREKEGEYILQCNLDPSRLSVCDMHGRILKDVDQTHIEHINRIGTRIDLKFVSGKSMSYTFKTTADSRAFCDSISAVLGIFVRQYHLNPNWEDEKDPKQLRDIEGVCPIHGDEPCLCAERPSNLPTERQEHDPDAEPTEDVPISIEGNCESESDLRLHTSGPRFQSGHITVEWRVSVDPGRGPVYMEENKMGHSILLTEDMVGHYVQARISRRLKSAAEAYRVERGPVGMTEKRIRSVMEILTRPDFSIGIQYAAKDAANVFGIHPSQMPINEPYLKGEVTIMRVGITLTCHLSNPMAMSIPFEQFYASRPECVTASTSGENSKIHINTLDSETMTLHHDAIILSNQYERDSVYYALAFLKLAGRVKAGFEVWDIELQRGNLAELKRR